MDRKRELTSVDLAALVSELRGYVGVKVDKVYLYGDDLLRLRMRDRDTGRVELLVEVGDPKRAHVVDPEAVPAAPDRPPDFAMQLRNRLSGADLTDVEQHGFDRILQFTFDRDDGRTTLVAELFGDGNVVVLDEDREVVQCLETVRLQSRTVAPGAPYEFPAARFDPSEVDRATFTKRMRDSDADVVRTLATQLNFGGLWAEELCTRGGVEKTMDVSEAPDEAILALYEAVDRLRHRLDTGDLDPRIYYESREEGTATNRTGTVAKNQLDADATVAVDVAPVPLEERAPLREVAFDSFNAALAEYFGELTRDTASTETGRPDFEAEIARQERIIQQQETAIEDFEAQAARERRSAELLYENYDLVDEIISTVAGAVDAGHTWDEIADRLAEGASEGIPAAEAVTDVDTRERVLTVRIADTPVTIDPSMGVEKNADRLYQEAKRVATKKEGAQTAVEETRDQLAELRRRRDEWTRDGSGGEDPSDGTEGDWLRRDSIPVRRQDQWYERFRWFHTSDDHLVLGGRNADQNEELVKKYLESGDRFLHATAHGGPVTVLKATGPSESARDVDIPNRSMEQAAQFALSYASVWKDGAFSGEVYMVRPEQVSKTPESGEYLEKGGFAIRGDRTYFDDVAVGATIGIQCEPETRVIGGPPPPIEARAATSIRVEPGRYAQNDIAKRLYRVFRERFVDTSFVRKVASPDRIQEFLPPGGSRMIEE